MKKLLYINYIFTLHLNSINIILEQLSALNQMNIFLASMKMKSYDQLVESEICTLVMMQKFATFLSFDCVQEDNRPISLGKKFDKNIVRCILVTTTST
jgi:hypothetical protein